MLLMTLTVLSLSGLVLYHNYKIEKILDQHKEIEQFLSFLAIKELENNDKE